MTTLTITMFCTRQLRLVGFCFDLLCFICWVACLLSVKRVPSCCVDMSQCRHIIMINFRDLYYRKKTNALIAKKQEAEAKHSR